MAKYDFSFMDDKDESLEEEIKRRYSPEDKRLNMRVSMCCGTCKNFTYRAGNKPQKGFCGILVKTRYKNRSKLNWELIKATWPRAHIKTVCDRHEFRSSSSALSRIGDWVGYLFNTDGTQREE